MRSEGIGRRGGLYWFLLRREREMGRKGEGGGGFGGGGSESGGFDQELD